MPKIDFHQLAREGRLNTLDPELLTEENLFAENHVGDTVLDEAIFTDILNQQNNLYQIPYPILLKNKEICLEEISEERYKLNLQKSKEIHIKKLKEKIPETLKTKNYGK
jgi:hypothetical protein